MDVFARTFLPAAAENGIALQTISRHMPIFRRCVGTGDAAILVTRCTRPDRPAHGEYLLLLTYRRLVVTRQTRLLHRLRLHLNTDLRHLRDVTWHPDPRLPAIELVATAIDGIRERFLIRAGHSRQVWQLDALLTQVFRTPSRAPGDTASAGGTPVGRSFT
ncbi:hypothetical protein V6U90_27385 [Micromonospora sp. CPCC 206060]|uniref:hypothetical protein n=1 Tax=Micromonospora sp. CPCC 206060 TaxID=3122406 RepID=UPI002FF1722A